MDDGSEFEFSGRKEEERKGGEDEEEGKKRKDKNEQIYISGKLLIFISSIPFIGGSKRLDRKQ